MGYGRRLLHALLGASLIATTMTLVGAARAADTECSTPATPAPNAKKILITGDSATNMSTGDYTWRYFLWKHFAANGTPVDFVGSWDGTFDYIGRSNENSHDYAACDFDWDHESRAGAKLADFTKPATTNTGAMDPYYPAADSWIEGAVAEYEPDVVVEFAGYNDLYRFEEDHSGTFTDDQRAATVLGYAQAYVQSVQEISPTTDVLLATVPSTGTNRYTKYTAALKAAAPGWSTDDSTVRVADLVGWTDHTWDGWHPDGQGDARIATVFAAAFHGLDSATYPAAGAVPTVSVGPRSPATITGATTPADNQVALSFTLSPNANRAVILGRDITAGGGWTVLADVIQDYYHSISPGIGTGACGSFFAGTRCTGWTVTGLIAGHQYEFTLRSGKGWTVATDLESNVVTATPTGSVPPPVPGKVGVPTTVSLEHAVQLSWTAVPDATGYQVRWKRAGTSTWNGPTPAQAGTTRVISGLPPGVVHDYQVRATGAAAHGDYSDLRSAAARAYKLAVPAKPRLTALKGRKIRVAWTAVPKASRYLVQVRLGARLVKSVFVTRATWTSGALVKGKTYKVTVRPYDGAYGGGTSAAASIKAK